MIVKYLVALPADDPVVNAVPRSVSILSIQCIQSRTLAARTDRTVKRVLGENM